MNDEFRGLDELVDAFCAEFGARSELDYFTAMPQTPDPVYVLISFKREDDIAASEASGLAEEMRAFVRARLAAAGHAGEPRFDFNSLERIGREAGGYFRYLR
ncbi:MAG: hypothetical protein K2X34_10920 [Hyphomonadaceae bacterium]|nr:hypothetical protein [Hyphomonadaceae bacterium]